MVCLKFMGNKKIYLEDSLEHLKSYIENIIGNDFDVIESHTGEGSRDFLKPMYETLMERINHAIDHIKVDHLDEQ